MSASKDPHRVLEKGIIRNYIVATGQTVKGGFGVAFASDDQEIQDCGADSLLCIGIARHPGTTYTAGQRVEVVHGYTAIVPVKVGTGGATRGKQAEQISDGFTDAPAWAASGSTVVPLYGQFLQSGLVGDEVGLGLYAGGVCLIAT